MKASRENAPTRSVEALDLYLAPVDRQRVRFQRTLLATGTAIGVLVLICTMFYAGMLSAPATLVGAGMVVAGSACIHLLLVTQLNKRMTDPSMTKLQTMSAAVTMICVAYMATPTGHGVALLTIPSIFVFSSFRFGFRELLKLGSFILALACLEVLIRFDLGRDAGAIQAVVHLIALLIALTTLAMVGGQFNDMRRRNRAERAISHVAMTQLSEAVVTVDPDGGVRFMNEGARSLFNLGAEDHESFEIDDLCQFTDQPPLSETLSELVRRIENKRRMGQPASNQAELVGGAIRRRDGAYRFIRLSVSSLLHKSGEVDGFVLVVRDVSDTQQLMEELQHAATHDVLTGLLNRRGFIAALQARLAAQAGGGDFNGEAVSVIAMDLDQFKMVNDACGHDAGDDLLRVVAKMMRSCVPGGAQLARLGGDEFGIILSDAALPHVELIANRLIREFSELRFVRQERSFKIGASIGIAQQSIDCPDAQSLLSRADSACYLAKQRGRNCIQIYSLGDVEVSRHQRDMSWASRIGDALEQQRFVLFAQRITPSVLVADDRDHFEVLIRMLEPDGTIIEPGAFLPAAERFSLISALDREVIRLTMVALAEMKQEGRKLPLISINLSPSSLRDRTLLRHIADSLGEFGVPGNQITFELTETAAIFDIDQAKRFFLGLKKLGCRVSLDDVGSGFNSFYNLRQLPVDQIKIDGSYVRSSCENPLDFAFVESIQRIATILKVQTVAEFVENDAIRAAMTNIGVDYLQGYGLHRPEPLNAATRVGVTPAAASVPAVARPLARQASRASRANQAAGQD